MERRKVSKLGKPIRPFEKTGGWTTVDSTDKANAVYRAMDNPVRRKILELLDDGPIRQIDLMNVLNRTIGRRYDAAAVIHHIKILERAGLVDHRDLPEKRTKVKMILRTKDVRLQVYKRPRLKIEAET